MIPMARIAAAASAVLLSTTGPVVARDEIRDLQWHLDYLHIDEAHQISRGTGIVVGVVDTGVEAAHPDLAANVLPGADFLGGASTGEGHEDRDGHGTAMAGLVSANGRATGIAPDAKVLPVRSSYAATSFTSETSAGIDWAIDHGAKILCLAFVGPYDPTVEDAVKRAIAMDVIVVAGIGNTTNSAGIYPAAQPGVVAVAGTDKDGNHAAISVTGAQAALAAPAVRILSTVPRSISADGYGTSDGTSNATAIVAGVAALVRAKYPNLSAAEVIHRMTATADDKGAPGRDEEYGYGIVNPVKALTADVPALTASAEPTATGAAPPAPGGSGRTPIVVGAAVVALLLAVVLLLARRRRT